MTWIEPLQARLDGESLTLGCPTGFHRDRVRDHYLGAIETAAAEEAGSQIAVLLVVSPSIGEEPAEFRVQDVPSPEPPLGPRGHAGETHDDTAPHTEAHDPAPRRRALKVPPDRDRGAKRVRARGATGPSTGEPAARANGPSTSEPAARANGEASPAPAGEPERSPSKPVRPPVESSPGSVHGESAPAGQPRSGREARDATSSPASVGSSRRSAARAEATPPASPPRAGSGARRERRRPEQRSLPYRFDNFVVGDCNALAREACLAVAQGTQSGLNPLVLAAPPGLGKTHLARAMVAEARRQGETRAIYASAEAFTTEFTTSLRAKRVDQFKRRYRLGCKLLVLEDMQFLDARKKATQLEIFHTVSHLLDVGAQVVLTADRQPRDIQGLDERLCSTLTQGVVAELQAPDAQVRREILRAKAADGGVRLPEECRELIVESVRGNVRDLEGVLIQLVATASLLKRPIDAELTLAALQKLALAPAAPQRLSSGDVLEIVAAYFQKPPHELALRTKKHEVLVPRQLGMYLCRKYTDATLTEIGALFGRDHSAVANAIKVVERRILERAPLRYKFEALSRRLDAEAKARG